MNHEIISTSILLNELNDDEKVLIIKLLVYYLPYESALSLFTTIKEDKWLFGDGLVKFVSNKLWLWKTLYCRDFGRLTYSSQRIPSTLSQVHKKKRRKQSKKKEIESNEPQFEILKKQSFEIWKFNYLSELSKLSKITYIRKKYTLGELGTFCHGQSCDFESVSNGTLILVTQSFHLHLFPKYLNELFTKFLNHLIFFDVLNHPHYCLREIGSRSITLGQQQQQQPCADLMWTKVDYTQELVCHAQIWQLKTYRNVMATIDSMEQWNGDMLKLAEAKNQSTAKLLIIRHSFKKDTNKINELKHREQEMSLEKQMFGWDDFEHHTHRSQRNLVELAKCDRRYLCQAKLSLSDNTPSSLFIEHVWLLERFVGGDTLAKVTNNFSKQLTRLSIVARLFVLPAIRVAFVASIEMKNGTTSFRYLIRIKKNVNKCMDKRKYNTLRYTPLFEQSNPSKNTLFSHCLISNVRKWNIILPTFFRRWQQSISALAFFEAPIANAT
ncbi:hypothetical protein RFI_00638 [Reticulomyxa filosa]|uniref:Uncharacterized protein n=1 Tax=Reticulomyxa filosa TaxID=46433 RepID=X6PEB0_RETFI|nr:hypothetical protein RFI_00638 [Reticulomyxa filosa]|eukprot:ETO36428.1 hypothetical protein RFI_00638 [Reticulomyxa filosa]